VLRVKIYAIVNPLNDDVLYIGASIKPKVRYGQHVTGKFWDKNLHRYKEMVKMKLAGITPELLILDDVDFPDVRFYEEFYMELFKTWGYNIQQSVSGYQTNKTCFNDGDHVYVTNFGFNGIVTDSSKELYVKVFFPVTQREMTVFVNNIELIK